MAERHSELDALREAIDAFAGARAPELVAQATADATARVRSTLTDALARGLLEHSSELIRGRTDAPPAKQRRDPSPRPARAETELGCYVYGVIRDTDTGDAHSGLPGVDGVHPTRIIAGGGLAAIVSDVPLSEFGEEPLMENLNDVGWLEQTARAHESVLEEAVATTTVVPLRLCTIYRGEHQVREMLDREGRALSEAIVRLTGRTEWGVKMIAEPGALEAALGAGDDPSAAPGAGKSPGTAYLDAKRREARATDEVDRIAESWAAEVHRRVANAAAEALLNPLQAPELSGHDGDMLLNGVYLVADDTAERFRRLVSDLAEQWSDRGVSVELTGPWPPYNFVKSSIEAAR